MYTRPDGQAQAKGASTSGTPGADFRATFAK